MDRITLSVQGCEGRSRQSIRKAISICTRVVGALDQDGGSESGEKELNSGYFEVRVTGFNDGPNGTLYIRTRIKVTPKFLAQATARMYLPLIEIGESVGGNELGSIFGAQFWTS